MGIFGKKTAETSLENDLWLLRKRVDELESSNKRLRLEWEELYDKVRHQMSRMSRRARASTQSEPTTPLDEQDTSPGDSLDPISRAIHKRRGMRAIKP